MPHGFEDSAGGQAVKIGLEHEGNSLPGALAEQAVDEEQGEQDEENRHEDLAPALDPLLHAAYDDAQAEQDEDEMPENLPRAIADQTAEHPFDCFRRLPAETAGDCPVDIVQGPAGHHRIVGEDEKGGADADPAGRLPEGALPFEMDEGADSIAAGVPADHQFGHHDRQADDGDAA